MEDGEGVSVDNLVNHKMGATGNPNAVRLATLQERKKSIEENLTKCTQQLRQLCIQEADLTGTIPVEMPLDPGESPPSIRRRVGTSFQLPESLIKNANNKDESVSDIELQSQLHANLAEAALGLANEQNISKTLRRQHMSEYQQHKQQFTALQEKLVFFKDVAKKQQQQQQQQQQAELHKPKKKPRPVDQDDNISMATTINESFGTSEQRHSIRSNKTVCGKFRPPENYIRGPRISDECSLDDRNYIRQHSDDLSRGFYRLSINGYKNYIERRENITNNQMSAPLNLNILHHYHQQMSHRSQSQQLSPHYQQYTQSSGTNSQMYPPPPPSQQKYYYPHSPTQVQIQQHQTQTNFRFPQLRQSSPDINSANTHNQKIFYQHQQPSPDLSNHQHLNYNARKYQEREQSYPNPHQIQPHQQYEHMTGLGGYWKPSETGDMIWCNSTNVDSNWHRDKRFGSLDRRKNKRLHKRISTNVDPKSATLAIVPTYSEHVRTAAINSPKVISRRSQDSRQLVRTQSLGSVGAQTIDSVWPSDDNSSCESDNRSILDHSRKQKQKEWLETSLDGPVSPTYSVISRSQSALPSVLSPEEKYISPPPPPLPIAKPSLEIPAESNPSPRILDTNIEIFNNNIPKNCTIVQAGHCKPYHEETKPFEMSDFYKYSTKFKRSPQKPPLDDAKKPSAPPLGLQRNLNETFENMSAQAQPVRNANLSPMSPASMDNSTNSLNSTLDLSQISSGNVAERFSDEMNAWYKSHKLRIESAEASSKGKSTATLV